MLVHSDSDYLLMQRFVDAVATGPEQGALGTRRDVGVASDRVCGEEARRERRVVDVRVGVLHEPA